MVSLSCNVSAIRVNPLSWRVYLESFSKNIKKSRAFQLFSPTEMIKIPAVFAEDWDALNEAEATLRVSEKSINFQVDTISCDLSIVNLFDQWFLSDISEISWRRRCRMPRSIRFSVDTERPFGRLEKNSFASSRSKTLPNEKGKVIIF